MTAKLDAPLSGVLIIDKPQGFTSFDVVAKLRGILHIRKIGHGGTLDPMATGVLPIFIGGATKAVDYATAQDKEYLAGFTLGICTDTQDISGKTLETSPLSVSKYQVDAVLSTFLGPQKQVPPMYSAVQIGGKRLYELARKGVEVERPARDIDVKELVLLDFNEQSRQGTIRAVVSKGTYIRTLIHDIGLSLGTFAAMHCLVRTRSGAFTLEQASSIDAVEEAAKLGQAGTLLRPTDSLFSAYPCVVLDEYGYQRACSGAFIAPAHASGMPMECGVICRVYFNNQFHMLGRTGMLQKGGIALFVHKNFQ